MVVDPFPVDELFSEEENIEWAAKRLRSNRSRDLSVMRAEHLQIWLAEARYKENTDATHWLKVVDLFQL